jgi:hypothetical protein
MLSLSGEKGYGYMVQGPDYGVSDGEGSSFRTILNRNLNSMLQFKSGARKFTLGSYMRHTKHPELMV